MDKKDISRKVNTRSDFLEKNIWDVDFLKQVVKRLCKINIINIISPQKPKYDIIEKVMVIKNDLKDGVDLDCFNMLNLI